MTEDRKYEWYLDEHEVFEAVLRYLMTRHGFVGMDDVIIEFVNSADETIDDDMGVHVKGLGKRKTKEDDI